MAIIGTGHLSLELGGPRQFGPHGPDPEFDRKAVRVDRHPATSKAAWPRSAWTACALPGNATHGFMDFMLMMGVAGEDVKADYVDSLDLFHTMEAYFTWYPDGARDMSKYLLEQVPVHRRPRPGTGRALPRRPARAPSPGGRPSGPT